MTRASRVLLAACVLPLLSAPGAFVPAPARAAGLGVLAQTLGTELVGPLAQRFGVPVGAVTGLLESGLTVEGVVQALLVAQTAKAPVDRVGSLLASNGNDLPAAASSLGVAPAAYGPDQVAAVLSEVQGSPAPVEAPTLPTPAVPAKPALGGLLSQ